MMIKVKSTIALIAFLTTNVAFTQAVQAENNECLGKICINMKESQVLSRLGKPTNSKYRGCGRSDLIYPQGKVSLQDGSTYAITTRSSRWKTGNGIKVGDNISKAKKINLKKTSYNLNQDKLSEYSVELLTGTELIFNIDKNSVIQRITLWRVTVC